MKKIYFFILSILVHFAFLNAQDNVGIGTLTPNAKALLDLNSSNKGLMVPRMTTAQRLAINPVGNADASLLVYDTNDNLFYFWNSTLWVPFPLNGDNISLNYNSNTGVLQLVDNGGNLTTTIAPNTDNQTLTLNTTTNILSILGGNTVDLSGYVNTDNQDLTSATLIGTTLTIAIQNGNPVSVDLSTLVGTDNQTLILTGNDLTITNGNTVDLSQFVNTDNQDLTSATLTGNILTIEIQNGAPVSVDLTALIGTDNQTLTLTGTDLTISNGNTIDLLPFLDNTDNQNLTSAVLTGTALTVSIQNGNPVSVDLASLIGTDNQNLTNATLTGNTLTIEIQNGNPVSVDLSALVGTDNQTLTLTGNDLSISNGNTVDLSFLAGDWKLLGNAGTNPTINFLGTTDAQDLVFRTNNVERIRTLASNGNVGIGTVTPQDRLQIQTNNSSIRLGTWSVNTNYNMIDLKGINNDNYNFLSSTIDQNLYINRPAANDIRFRAANIDQMIIRTGGNVGIATVTPVNRLDVNGSVAIGAFAGTNAAPANGLIVSGNVRIGAVNANTIAPAQADAGIIKFDQSGGYARLGNINSDPGVGGVIPGSSFTGGVGALAVGMNRTGGRSNVDFWNTTSHNQVAANLVNDRGFNWRRYNQAGTEQLLMTLDGSGNLTIAGTNYFTSDRRIKSEVKPFENNVLDKVLMLKPSTYTKSNSALNNGNNVFYSADENSINDFGFIAQEVFEIFPELVYKPADESKELWAVDYARLSVMLAKAIQEQQLLIESLQNDNNLLKAISIDNNKQFEELKTELEVIKSFIFQRAEK